MQVAITIDDGPGDDHIDGGSGDNLFLNGPGDDVLAGHGHDRYLSGPGADTFGGDTSRDADDALDTVSYAAETQPVHVDTSWDSSGTGYDDDGVAGEHDTLRHGIERVELGSGDDVLETEDGWVREVVGGAGDDTLTGPAAREGRYYLDPLTLDGGPGADRLSSAGRHARLLGGDGADTLAGGTFPDVLDGGAGNDVLSGGADADTLDGGTGADRIAGGDGIDTVDYAGRRGDLRLTLDDVADDGEAGEHDQLGGDVERLVGGRGDDLLSGNHGGNTLEGGAGDDHLFGGGGRDVLYGGAGSDTADFSDLRDDARITMVEAGHSTVYGGHIPTEDRGDRFYDDVENVIGGSGDDILTGNTHANRLDGGPGDDVLDGGRGPDVLSGGPGFDTTDYTKRTRSAARHDRRAGRRRHRRRGRPRRDRAGARRLRRRRPDRRRRRRRAARRARRRHDPRRRR